LIAFGDRLTPVGAGATIDRRPTLIGTFMRSPLTRLLWACSLCIAVVPAAIAQQCPASVPVQGAPVAAPLPVFPADNWWNTDIRSATVDPASASFIAFINNGGTRRLHPDFGGEESSGSTAIYGFPYAIVNGAQAKQAVTFDYWDESDGVDFATGQGVPFYPIPTQAITQPHWVEGGAPGNVDQRNVADRHLLVIDCSNRYLYELYNVYYSPTESRWHAGSGAFFDMNRNARRPDTWTSADAAGLAIFPGLVRYDEAANPAVTEINHAFRVTVRTSNGYVYPASHRAGNTAGALPMGARLRLKASVNGADPALRTTDPVARKIFRAMQKYGLIVADNGSDMYISGTFDVRWDNGVLNPAFSTLSASDFEVVQLGWKPAAALTRATHDFDGDGRSDILWRNGVDGKNSVWRSANATTSQSTAAVTDLRWRVAGVGDFDADGKADILWRNTATGANTIWRSGNNTTPQSVTTVTSQAWQMAAVADFDGDGGADILWRNASTGANTIWKRGTANMQKAVVTVADLDWHIVGAGDFNHDGQADILWRNFRTGANTIWRSANASAPQAVTGVTSLAWQVVAVADFNGDRNADIFWRNRDAGSNAIWRSGDGDALQAVSSMGSPAWIVAGARDYGGDGVADILWRNQTTGTNVIWKSANSGTMQAVTGVTNLAWTVVP
jgi:hypothetical protein